MKVLFTADIHIRIGQRSIPRAWARKKFEKIFQEIDRVYNEYNCELEIHGGDIFDKVPSLEEISIYLQHLHETKDKPRIVYDGNHEATKKGDTFLKYLNKAVPKSTEIITEITERYGMDILPYCNLHSPLKPTSNILLTHVRGDIPPHVEQEIDLNKFINYDIVFAGDLHSHSNSQRNIVYPGSPSTVTYHRNPVKTGVIVFDTESPTDWEWVQIDTPQLIRKTVETKEEMVKTEYNHTIYELVGNILDSSKVDNNAELLDKKILDISTEASLSFDNSMTLEDEVRLYLENILKLSPEVISELMKVYYDNI